MTGETFDLFDEIRAVSAEALRLARDGGSVDERTAYMERKARVMDELEARSAAGMSTRAIAPVVGVSKSLVAEDIREVSTSGHLPPVEPVYVNTETGEVSDDYPARCADWPLCGHDERDGCDEHAAIQQTIDRTKGALRARGALD